MPRYMYHLSSACLKHKEEVVSAWNLIDYPQFDIRGSITESYLELDTHDEYRRDWSMNEDAHKQRWKELAKVPELSFKVLDSHDEIVFIHEATSFEKLLEEQNINIDGVLFKDMSLKQLELFNIQIKNLLETFKSTLLVIPKRGDIAKGISYIPDRFYDAIKNMSFDETLKYYYTTSQWHNTWDLSVYHGIVKESYKGFSNSSKGEERQKVRLEDNTLDIFEILDKNTMEPKMADSKEAVKILEEIKEFTKKHEYTKIDTYINQMGELLNED